MHDEALLSAQVCICVLLFSIPTAFGIYVVYSSMNFQQNATHSHCSLTYIQWNILFLLTISNNQRCWLLWFFEIKQWTSYCIHFLVLLFHFFVLFYFVLYSRQWISTHNHVLRLKWRGSATFNEHLSFWRCSNFMNLTVIKRHKFSWNKHLFSLNQTFLYSRWEYSISCEFTYTSFASLWKSLSIPFSYSSLLYSPYFLLFKFYKTFQIFSAMLKGIRLLWMWLNYDFPVECTWTLSKATSDKEKQFEAHY